MSKRVAPLWALQENWHSLRPTQGSLPPATGRSCSLTLAMGGQVQPQSAIPRLSWVTTTQLVSTAPPSMATQPSAEKRSATKENRSIRSRVDYSIPGTTMGPIQADHQGALND